MFVLYLAANRRRHTLQFALEFCNVQMLELEVWRRYVADGRRLADVSLERQEAETIRAIASMLRHTTVRSPAAEMRLHDCARQLEQLLAAAAGIDGRSRSA